MVTESDTESIQVEIVPSRFLMPVTAQKLLNEIYGNGGIIRIMIHGPNLPRSVPYGPGRGPPSRRIEIFSSRWPGRRLSSALRLVESGSSWRATNTSTG